MGPYSISSIAGLIQSLLQGKKQTDPIANYEQDFGMGGGSLNNIGAGPDIRQGPDIPNYRQPHSLYPDQIGIVPQEYLRASQRRGYVPDINPYDFTGIPGGGQSDKSIEAPDAVAGAENAAIEATNLADQNKEGLGPNYGGRQWYDRDFATLAKRVPIGRAYPGERTDFTPSSQADWSRAVAMPRPSEMIGQHADWSTPASAVSSGPTFAERDMLASAGENRDLLGIGQPVGSPPVDPREIAIKKRFGKNVGNLWGDVRLRERMQDLYGGSF